MNVSRRILVIGLDAADSTLIQRWSDEGVLPTLAFLRREGTWISLAQDQPIPSASVWPSIYTGTYPGKHGIYNGLQIEPGKQEVELIKTNQCGEPPFWQILDGHGISTVIMDVPFSFPLKNFGGVQLLDWGSFERHYRSQSSPDEVLIELSKRFGAYPFGQEMSRDTPSTRRHLSHVRAQLLAGTSVKGRAVRWLMRYRSWDFLMAVFSETHPVGHYFWDFHSQSQRDSSTDSPPALVTAIKDVYRAVDAEIAKIIKNLDEATTLVILSGQGMGPNIAKWHFIPDILSGLGLLVSGARRDRISPARLNLAELRAAVPRQWRRVVSRYLPGSLRDHLQVYWANSCIDWAQTRAFPMPTDLLGYIRVNLKGREPRGIVEPGSEYDEVCAEIGEALKEMVDPNTGRRIVREVYHADQIFPGPQRSRLPDLIVSWKDEPEGNEGQAETWGGIGSPPLDHRQGNHRHEGFAIFHGQKVKKDRVDNAHLIDIAPTILRYFGLTPPSTMDGQNLVDQIC